MICLWFTVLFSLAVGLIFMFPATFPWFGQAILPWGMALETCIELLAVCYLFIKWLFDIEKKALGIIAIIAVVAVIAGMATGHIPNIYEVIHDKVDYWIWSTFF